MRTLDEVIKAFEYTYENDPIAWTYGIDALHYLQEYKNLKRTAKVVHKWKIHIITPPESTTNTYETLTNLWNECGDCGAMGMYHGWKYCLNCGAKLDWSGNERN